MAQGNQETGNAAPAPAAFPHGDGDIIVGVSAKDAARGHYGVLPAPKLPADLSPGLATALHVGLYYDAIRSAQSVATRALKENKDVREAVGAHLKTFAPDATRSVNTIGAKRVDLACEMAAKALSAKNGKTVDPADLRNEPTLPSWMERHAAQINTALLAYLADGYEVTKKGTRAAPGSVDLNSLD